jgi:hypothetical protein
MLKNPPKSLEKNSFLVLTFLEHLFRIISSDLKSAYNSGFFETQIDLYREKKVKITVPSCLVHLVRLQTDNFHLFLRKQTDKQQTSVCTMSKQ